MKRYAVYANWHLVLVTSDHDEATARYHRAKMDPDCKHVAIGKVRKGQSAPASLERS
jgi:hypothetical protein